MKLIGRISVALLLIYCVTLTPLSTAGSQATSARARLLLVFVVDGLRPDSINAEDTPTIDRLRREGVHYVNSRCVFPSVTRVNAAAISTGTYPQRNGLVSNTMFHPGVYANKALNTGEWKDLLKLAEVSKGELLFTRSLAERLTERGIRFAAVSSGSTGNALLLNHKGPSGVSILVNGNFEPGKRVAFPDVVNSQILERFGSAPLEEGSPLVDWTDRVLREYILPVHKPQVLIDWLTEPDGAQHRYGVGSREARDALRNSDRNIGLTLQKVEELGFAGATDVIVLSDHGFSWNNFGVNLANELVGAGLKKSQDSDDVVIASNGQSVLLYVKNHDRVRTEAIVRFLDRQPWIDVVFTRGPAQVRGTFPLELVHQANPQRAPDIFFTLRWDSNNSAAGVSGTHHIASNGANGALTGTGSGHGGLSNTSMRNTMILWGADFRKSTPIRLPASNIDIAPTIMSLFQVPGLSELDGRVLSEAFLDGPDPEQVVSSTVAHRVSSGFGESIVEIATLGTARYVTKGWRVRPVQGRQNGSLK